MDPITTAIKAAILSSVSEAVRPAVAEALADALPEVIRRAKLPLYLTRRQVIALTGWSDRHLSYLQAGRRIPFLKRGRTVLFRAADVERYMLAGFVVPADWQGDMPDDAPGDGARNERAQ